MSSSSVTSFSSAETSGFPLVRETESALPRFCSCGRVVVVQMSRTTSNPWRLFFTCPSSRGEDNTHLFKWVDESMVEEVHVLANKFSDLRAHMERVEVARRHEREVANTLMTSAQNLMREAQNLMREAQT